MMTVADARRFVASSSVAFLSGGYLPAAVRGGTYSGLISVTDWYGTPAALAGVPPHGPVAALPPIDSVVGLWGALMVPNGTSSPRTELLLSYYCVVGATANVSGCDPEAVSKYGTELWLGLHAGLAAGKMAYLSWPHKIIYGQHMGLGVWTGHVYPNGTHEGTASPCVEGCVFDLLKDPTEHHDLQLSEPALFESLRQKRLEEGKSIYQTDYAEPGTAACLNGSQARNLYRNVDVNGTQTPFLGPMCFSVLPPVPPPPQPSDHPRMKSDE
jgi:hypothetical protein